MATPDRTRASRPLEHTTRRPNPTHRRLRPDASRHTPRLIPSLLALLCLTTLVTIIGCTPGTAESGAVLRFSAIPDQSSTELQEKFDAIAKYLTDALGVSVEYVPATDYKASVEMFKNGDVQLAWFGGLTGVQARQAVKGA